MIPAQFNRAAQRTFNSGTDARDGKNVVESQQQTHTTPYHVIMTYLTNDGEAGLAILRYCTGGCAPDSGSFLKFLPGRIDYVFPHEDRIAVCRRCASTGFH